ncbi:unnamed protein product [Closterium sp. Naga37s-1]|nr:unnamed protein product [Closterium sp. Naga37s-1]
MAAAVLDTSDAISTAPPVQVQVISQWETALQSMVEEKVRSWYKLANQGIFTRRRTKCGKKHHHHDAPPLKQQQRAGHRDAGEHQHHSVKHHKKHHRGAENAAAPAHAVDVRVECEEAAAENTPLLTASRAQQLEQKLLKGERVRAVWGIVTVGILVAPACACALFALLFPALLPSCLAVWAIVEVIFVAIRYQQLRRASAHRPELPLPSLESVSDLLSRILKLKGIVDARYFFEGWFHNTPLERLTREHIKQFLSFGFFYRSFEQLSPEYQEAVEGVGLYSPSPFSHSSPTPLSPSISAPIISNTPRPPNPPSSPPSSPSFPLLVSANGLYRAGGTYLAHGLYRAREPIRAVVHPLFVYAWGHMVAWLTWLCLALLGFRRHVSPSGLHYFHCPGWKEQKGSKAHKAEAEAESGADGYDAVVFIHGLGIGLTPYLAFIHMLLAAFGSKPFIVVELPHLACQLTSAYPLFPLTLLPSPPSLLPATPALHSGRAAPSRLPAHIRIPSLSPYLVTFPPLPSPRLPVPATPALHSGRAAPSRLPAHIRIPSLSPYLVTFPPLPSPRLPVPATPALHSGRAAPSRLPAHIRIPSLSPYLVTFPPLPSPRLPPFIVVELPHLACQLTSAYPLFPLTLLPSPPSLLPASLSPPPPALHSGRAAPSRLPAHIRIPSLSPYLVTFPPLPSPRLPVPATPALHSGRAAPSRLPAHIRIPSLSPYLVTFPPLPSPRLPVPATPALHSGRAAPSRLPAHIRIPSLSPYLVTFPPLPSPRLPPFIVVELPHLACQLTSAYPLFPLTLLPSPPSLLPASLSPPPPALHSGRAAPSRLPAHIRIPSLSPYLVTFPPLPSPRLPVPATPALHSGRAAPSRLPAHIRIPSLSPYLVTFPPLPSPRLPVPATPALHSGRAAPSRLPAHIRIPSLSPYLVTFPPLPSPRLPPFIVVELPHLACQLTSAYPLFPLTLLPSPPSLLPASLSPPPQPFIVVELPHLACQLTSAYPLFPLTLLPSPPSLLPASLSPPPQPFIVVELPHLACQLTSAYPLFPLTLLPSPPSLLPASLSPPPPALHSGRAAPSRLPAHIRIPSLSPYLVTFPPLPSPRLPVPATPALHSGRAVPSPFQTDALVETLCKHGYKRVAYVGHSYSTFIAATLLRRHRSMIAAMSIIDPVCLLLCLPKVLHTFVYSLPGGDHLAAWIGESVRWVLCSRELQVARSICRGFSWQEYLVWGDELPPASLVMLAGDDQLVPSPQVQSHLARHNVNVIYNDGFQHAEYLTRPDVQHKFVMAFAATCAKMQLKPSIYSVLNPTFAFAIVAAWLLVSTHAASRNPFLTLSAGSDAEFGNQRSVDAKPPAVHDQPLIGILSQPGDGDGGRAPRVNAKEDLNVSYIAASYVKWVESAGARPVPILYDDPDWLMEKKFRAINGLILPGGGTDLVPGPFFSAVEKLLKMALAANDAGDYFPVQGTCMGMETLTIFFSQDFDILETKAFNAEDSPESLTFTSEEAKRRAYFSWMTPDLLDRIQREKITMENHEDGTTVDRFLSSKRLREFFRILTTSVDRNGTVSALPLPLPPFLRLLSNPQKY